MARIFDHREAAPIMTERARAHRQESTRSERTLWRLVRDRQFSGLKFRRQHVIEPYIADFYCAEHRLVLELDGISHDGKGDYDDRRAAWLESQGYTVLRFMDSDLMDHPDAVAEAILRAVGRWNPRGAVTAKAEGC